ncbi:MAG: hypothetical protein ACKOEE_09405, partial [Tagaea sp.]
MLESRSTGLARRMAIGKMNRVLRATLPTIGLAGLLAFGAHAQTPPWRAFPATPPAGQPSPELAPAPNAPAIPAQLPAQSPSVSGTAPPWANAPLEVIRARAIAAGGLVLRHAVEPAFGLIVLARRNSRFDHRK